MTQIWAHRGASAYAPENTLESFKLAIEMQADGIELDAHLTADKQLAVSHDGNISRCSDGEGDIAEMTLTELRKYSYAASFGEVYKNVMLPTLGEVFDLMAPTGMVVNVELKASGDEFLNLVYECEKAHNMTGKVIYSSFNHFNLTRMLELDPDAFVAPLYGDGIVKPWMYAASFGAKALHPHFASVYNLPDYVKKSHELGIRVHPWTVDDEINIKKLLDMGVDAIITNRPDLARKIRDNG